MAINVSSATDRVIYALQEEFKFLCGFAAEEHADKVESEIELMFLTTLDMFLRISKNGYHVGEEFPDDRPCFLITPQFIWESYRIDFCLRHNRDDRTRLLFVECDGHDFHERTKEQAERDRSKDRAIQAAGIPVLRFTGREIWRDPLNVMIEVLKFMTHR
jgi:hypothetical protein